MSRPICIGDLESVKRAFCNGEINDFSKLVKSAEPSFVMFLGDGDLEKIPMDFIVKNRVGGFAQTLDKNTKWVFTCFRADRMEDDSGNNYKFTSCWIVNTTTSLDDLGIDTESWTMTDASADEVVDFFTKEAEEGMKRFAH